MNHERWTAIDSYFTTRLIPPDADLDAALAASAQAGLPSINVSPLQGQFLQLLALACGARRILEVGTLGGYSSIWMGRALHAGGTLITLEVDPHHASVARANLDRAGLAERVEIRLGPAADSLARIVDAADEPFDLIFIDADKPNNPVYVAWALRLIRPGGLIVLDNVVRGGAVADLDSTDPNIQGVQQAIELLALTPHVSATAIQTVGSKGYDGFVLARVGEATA
jgi:predicted O-methyltransferase YrrM